MLLPIKFLLLFFAQNKDANNYVIHLSCYLQACLNLEPDAVYVITDGETVLAWELNYILMDFIDYFYSGP